MLNNKELAILQGITYQSEITIEDTHISLVSFCIPGTLVSYSFQFHFSSLETTAKYFLIQGEDLQLIEEGHPLFAYCKVLSKVRKLEVNRFHKFIQVGSFYAVSPGDIFLLQTTNQGSQWLFKDVDPSTPEGYLTSLKELPLTI